jgi:hypothetical protein
MPFFKLSEFGKNRTDKQQRGLFNMTNNMITNPVKLPVTMPTIFLEISEFGDHHPMLNHF